MVHALHNGGLDWDEMSPSPSVGEGQRVLGRGKHHVKRTPQTSGPDDND